MHFEFTKLYISLGGRVNIVDEDGETPLFVTETVDVARFLVEHGARVDHRNLDAMSVSQTH